MSRTYRHIRQAAEKRFWNSEWYNDFPWAQRPRDFLVVADKYEHYRWYNVIQKWYRRYWHRRDRRHLKDALKSKGGLRRYYKRMKRTDDVW